MHVDEVTTSSAVNKRIYNILKSLFQNLNRFVPEEPEHQLFHAGKVCVLQNTNIKDPHSYLSLHLYWKQPTTSLHRTNKRLPSLMVLLLTASANSCCHLFAVKCDIRRTEASTRHTLKVSVYLGCRLSSQHRDYKRGKDEGLVRADCKSQGNTVCVCVCE